MFVLFKSRTNCDVLKCFWMMGGWSGTETSCQILDLVKIRVLELYILIKHVCMIHLIVIIANENNAIHLECSSSLELIGCGRYMKSIWLKILPTSKKTIIAHIILDGGEYP